MKRSKEKHLVVKRTEDTLDTINELLGRSGLFDIIRCVQTLIINTSNMLAQGGYFRPFSLFSIDISAPFTKIFKPIIGEIVKASKRIDANHHEERPSFKVEGLKRGQDGRSVENAINFPLWPLLPSLKNIIEKPLQNSISGAQNLRIARNFLSGHSLTFPLLYSSFIKKTKTSSLEETGKEGKPGIHAIPEKVFEKNREGARSIQIGQTLQRMNNVLFPLLKPVFKKESVPDRVKEFSSNEKETLLVKKIPAGSSLSLKEHREADIIRKAERMEEKGYFIPIQGNLQMMSSRLSLPLRPFSIREEGSATEKELRSEESETAFAPVFSAISSPLLKEPMKAQEKRENARLIEEDYSIPIQQTMERISRLVSPLLRPISTREKSPVREREVPPKEAETAFARVFSEAGLCSLKKAVIDEEIELSIDTHLIRKEKQEKNSPEPKPAGSTTCPPELYISPLYKAVPRIMSLVEKSARFGWISPAKINEKMKRFEPLFVSGFIEETNTPAQESHASKYEKTTIIPQEYSAILRYNFIPFIHSIKNSLTRMVSSTLKSEEMNIPADSRVSTEPNRERNAFASPGPVVNNTFNVSIQIGDMEKEENFRELTDKICKILIDEGRRYGMDLT